MDKEPLIIKSGAGHKVEIEQGSTHAKGRRNVVAPAEDQLSDHVVNEGLAEERKQFDLSAAAKEEATSIPQHDAVTLESAGASQPVQRVLEPESAAVSTQAAAQVSEPAEAAPATQGPLVQRQILADRDATADKAEVVADRFLGGQDGTELSEERVSVPEALPLTNRQKIEQLQSLANTILVHQADRPLGHLDIESMPQEAAAAMPTSEDELPVVDLVPEEVVAVSPTVSPVASDDLPPELAGNVGFVPASKESHDSAFLARVRALRNNMSVTDHRLTALQDKPPAKR